MKFSRIAALLLAALLTLGGCQSGEAPSGSASQGSEPSQPPQSSSQSGGQETPGELPIPGIDAQHYPSINGSTANHPLICRIYSQICGVPLEDAETMVDLDMGSTGSIWEEVLLGGGPDMLIVYEPPEEIKEQYPDALARLEIDPLGRDGLVFLVNARNTVDSLTVEQLQGIYTGEITDWSQVGGEAGAIRPFQRNADSGSQTLFLKLLMDGLTPMDPPTELVQVTMGGLIDGVASFDGSGEALGYSVYYYASLMYANPDLKILSVDGVEPSAESIGNKSYPLTNDFYVVIRADEPEDSPVRLLRDWLLTGAGKELLTEENYVWARDGLPEESAGPGNPFA
jgi:phosphate transport system substrate-binding protein